jgi:glycine/D-amino acid oxidase-like deaminating enzyme
MPVTADAIVIGAGVIGGSIAFELAKLGFGAVLVEKGGAAGHGSTSASSAIIRFNYSTLDGVATSWEAKHCWETWSDHLGRMDKHGLASFQQTGMIVLDSPIAPREWVIALFEQVGVTYEEWDAASLRARIPGIDARAYWPPKRIDDDAFFLDADHELGGLFMPDAGFVNDPQLAAQNLVTAAQDLGTTLLLNHTVTEIIQRNERVAGVRFSNGEVIESPVVINAAGPWSGQINRLAGVGAEFTIGVRPLRQEVHYVQAPSGFNARGALGPSIADSDLGTYIRAAAGDKIMVGGTEPECDALDWIENPDDSDPNVTASCFERQVVRAARRLSTLGVPITPKGVAGVYDVSDDWQPIYDRTDLAGFYVAMGTSGNQFKNAPLVGRFLASLVESVEAGHDHDEEPLQYMGEHTGNSINLGAFSRKRQFNMNTSGNVWG